MKLSYRLIGAALLSLFAMTAMEARIKLTGFTNESNRAFNYTFDDGRPYFEMINSGEPVLIDQEGAVIRSRDNNFIITFEDAHRSGYHRPHWKFHVWLESKKEFAMLPGNKILYAVVFYDGDGEVQLHLDSSGKLNVRGGYDVKDILYPWAKGTIGRGNPYHEIIGKEIDENGIVYFDYDGFVGYPDNHFTD